MRTGADGYDDALGRVTSAKGERAAVVTYLEPDESVALRLQVAEVGEAGGRVLLAGTVVVVVTDRKLVAARTSGGFRPTWEVFTLPYGHLEPGVATSGADHTDVLVPTSGRRSYRVALTGTDAAEALTRSLGAALGAYRRDRMGLLDP